ncbi:MAG: hypothetical protein N2645_14625 [Clostridia bacterium]|nr:hypothetical protein [Clostridia bacterium]
MSKGEFSMHESLDTEASKKDRNPDPITASSIEPSRLLLDTSDPLYRIPAFLSYARPYNDMQQIFLDRVIEEIKERLIFPRTLGRSDQNIEDPLTAIRRMILSSYGMLAIAFRRAFVKEAISRPQTDQQQIFQDFWLSSPYLQIEPSMAYQHGLPIMLMVEDGVSTNSTFGGVLEQGAGPFNIIRFDLQTPQSIPNFFNSVFWKETFEDWVGAVRCAYNKQTEPNFKCNYCC